MHTGHKLNVHKRFRRRPGRLLNVLCTLNLRPVSTGKMNLKIDSSTVALFCESCEMFENTYFVEHLRTAVCTINIDAKYSLPGQ